MSRHVLSRDDVLAAQARLAGKVRRTPVLRNRQFNSQTRAQLWLKAENLQHIGAFKARGAFHAVSKLNQRELTSGLVTYSSGNHAQALAWVAGLFHTKATIFMPVNAPELKVAAVKRMGATIIPVGTTSTERQAAARDFVASSGGVIVEPFDHPDIIAGQGTAFLELQSQVSELFPGSGTTLDTLYVPVGGGGLIAGACLAFAGSPTEIIAVEPEGCDSMNQSIRAGKVVAVDPGPSFADGLKPTRVGSLNYLNYEICKSRLASTVTVNDDEIGRALVQLLLRTKTLAEPSGAAALAAALRDAKPRTRIGVLISGGNLALPDLGKILNQYGSSI